MQLEKRKRALQLQTASNQIHALSKFLTKQILLFSVILFTVATVLTSEENQISFKVNLKGIVELNELKAGTFRNPKLFDQYIQEVELNSKLNAQGKDTELAFYKYKVKEGDTLFAVAARCSVPYETIATINSINSPLSLAEGSVIILPTAAGIFVKTEPKSPLEILVANSDIAIEQKAKILYNITLDNGASQEFFFLQNARLSPTERAYFLDTSLRIPLDKYRITSAYGMRVSPISGNKRFHNGIDLAAPEGTPVYACKSGRVILAKMGDAVFGNHVIVQHDGGMTSLYAHLSRITVSNGATVAGGQEIGKVGQTGLATGPHLHFEVRLNGSTTNPERMFTWK